MEVHPSSELAQMVGGGLGVLLGPAGAGIGGQRAVVSPQLSGTQARALYGL